MILISHRGNISGPEPSKENSLPFIQAAINAGYDVEIDVRLIEGDLYLGHDMPDYPVDLFWLSVKSEHLWLHAKNFGALQLCLDEGLRVFYHQKENHTVIGNTKLIWSHDISEASNRSIVPMLGIEDIEANGADAKRFYAVCSDYVEKLT